MMLCIGTQTLANSRPRYALERSSSTNLHEIKPWVSTYRNVVFNSALIFLSEMHGVCFNAMKIFKYVSLFTFFLLTKHSIVVFTHNDDVGFISTQ